jgi:DNA-directed RNA polymerase specialized sigma24 family protein
LVCRAGVPVVDVDDVTQEVMLAIDRSVRTSFAVPPGQTREKAWFAWTSGVVRIQVVRYWSDRARTSAEQPFAEPEDFACAGGLVVQSVEELALLREERTLALELLGELQADRQTVFVAYEVDGEPMAKVAAGMGLRLNTAWNLLRLARADVRSAFARRRARERHREIAASQDRP